MPFTRIAVREGRSVEDRRALSAGVHRALQRAFNVPEDDIFMLVTQHAAEDFIFGRRYLGIERSDDLVMLQITVSDTRTREQKRELYRLIVEELGASPGVRPEDVLISLVEVKLDDWSFGMGLAQYAN
ncbi:tautomerase family protein [Burkholderia gladioli]|uniref:tautomerase family protein n=1 Tax=Burkholderia gladioli TaxID=28095 RepID=UPI00163F8F04|nr:tautomerase family protein [Burkholderia gladioli]